MFDWSTHRHHLNTFFNFLRSIMMEMRGRPASKPTRLKIKLEHIHELLHVLIHKVDHFMATTKERLDAIAAGIDAASAQLTKATTEILQEIADLKAANPDIEAGLSSLESKVVALQPIAQTLDDLNPDAGPTP